MLFVPGDGDSDDLFMLYAALFKSDPCYFLSNDKFRDHFPIAMEPVLRQEAARWQECRRVTIHNNTLDFPLPFTRQVYTAHHSFHVPDVASRHVLCLSKNTVRREEV